MAQQNEILR
jgi:hypothetical protein